MASNRAGHLFVARLPWTVCRETLREHFQQFGKVSYARVVFDKNNGRSKRYGFVEFESPESQKRALEEPQHIIEGGKVIVQIRETAERGRNRGRRDEDFTEV